MAPVTRDAASSSSSGPGAPAVPGSAPASPRPEPPVRHAVEGVRAPLLAAPRRPLPLSRLCSCLEICGAPRTTPALRSLPPMHERLAHFASETISWQKRVSFVRRSFTIPASDRGGRSPPRSSRPIRMPGCAHGHARVVALPQWAPARPAKRRGEPAHRTQRLREERRRFATPGTRAPASFMESTKISAPSGRGQEGSSGPARSSGRRARRRRAWPV